MQPYKKSRNEDGATGAVVRDASLEGAAAGWKNKKKIFSAILPATPRASKFSVAALLISSDT